MKKIGGEFLLKRVATKVLYNPWGLLTIGADFVQAGMEYSSNPSVKGNAKTVGLIGNVLIMGGVGAAVGLGCPVTSVAGGILGGLYWGLGELTSTVINNIVFTWATNDDERK